MNSWRPYPLLRLLFPFLAGIITGILQTKQWQIDLWVNILLFLPAIFYCFFPLPVASYRFRWITGVAIFFVLALAGYQLIALHSYPGMTGFFGRNPSGVFLVVVDEPPVTTKGGYKVTLGMRNRLEGRRWVVSAGRGQAWCKSGDSGRSIQYGDILLIKGCFQPIATGGNPHSFNYSAFLRTRGITHEIYLNGHAWRKFPLPVENPLRKWAFDLRNRLLDIFRQQKITGKEFAVAAALLLGYTNAIDPELRRDYSATGAMHILSVSGMHVGIIYLFLDFLLGFIGKKRKFRIIKMLILIIFIWFYAVLTGMSPSVIRSAAMLSLIIIGRSLDRSPDMFNILSASLIMILAADPFLVMDIGFQLSYIAVIGIVTLYRPIYEFYSARFWLAEKIWSIVACSLAATLATLPLTLMAFHQFPNYFIVTNIIVVPLSSLIIYAGIFALVFSPFHGLSMLLGAIFSWLVWLMNTLIHLIESLPCSTLRGIFLSFEELVVIYLFIALAFLFLITKERRYLYLTLVSMILQQACVLQFQLVRLSYSALLVYQVKGCVAVDVVSQDKAMLFLMMKEPAEDLPASLAGIAYNNSAAHGIKSRLIFKFRSRSSSRERLSQTSQVLRCGNFIAFGTQRIVILDEKIPRSLTKQIRADYLILTGNPKVTLKSVCSIFKPGEILIDGNNSRWKTREWEAQAASLGVKCHLLERNGAFEKEF